MLILMCIHFHLFMQQEIINAPPTVIKWKFLVIRTDGCSYNIEFTSTGSSGDFLIPTCPTAGSILPACTENPALHYTYVVNPTFVTITGVFSNSGAPVSETREYTINGGNTWTAYTVAFNVTPVNAVNGQTMFRWVLDYGGVCGERELVTDVICDVCNIP